MRPLPIRYGKTLQDTFVYTEQDIMENYPGITRDDILACLAYASDIRHEEKVYPR